MRLTRAWATNEEGKALEYIAIPVDDTKVQYDVWQKLGKLEDIEDKHKISSADDLDKRLKALDTIKEMLESNIGYKLNANSRKIIKEIFESLPKEKQDLLKEVLS